MMKKNRYEHQQPPPSTTQPSPGRTAGKKESSIGNLGNTYGGASDEDIQAVLSAARHGRVQEVGAYLDQGVPENPSIPRMFDRLHTKDVVRGKYLRVDI